MVALGRFGWLCLRGPRILSGRPHPTDAVTPNDAPMDAIKIRGARTHNLKNISLDIPRNRLTVITGLSGSQARASR